MAQSWVDVGAAVWSFVLFVPLFLLLFFVGIGKGILIAPLALAIIFVGNVTVALALWPAFVYWIYESIIKTRKLGLLLKLVAALCAPLPLVLWPAAVICGSVLTGLGYGFFTPLVATFEAVSQGRTNKARSCILDGSFSTVKGSCTVVRDFTDWCYHSCPAYIADFRDGEAIDGPYNIRLLEIPTCFVAAVLGVMVDVPLFAIISLIKSPFMLVKGWERLLDDLIVSQEGTCVKVVCVPFAGLAILLWPLVVVAAVVSGVFTSIFVGLYAAVIVHKENSFKSGLAYIVAMGAEFDEQTNDVLYLREGSCLPRPSYSSRVSKAEDVLPDPEKGHSQKAVAKQPAPEQKPSEAGMIIPQLSASKSLKRSIQDVKMVQVWEHMFKSCCEHSKDLIHKGVLKTSDLEEYLSDKSKNKLIAVKLPAYSLLMNLIFSAKSSSTGLVLYSGLELTVFNRPEDRLLDWFFEPLLVLKEQIRAAKLHPSEERYLEKLTLLSSDAEWDNGAIAPQDNVRKGELEALSRRIQGISTSVSRFPTFRRRYENFIKSLLVYSQASSQTPAAV
ncbi:uncharacterized membrane protein At3g27390 [Selaginella moellendorffii]|uniref:uncharacterized membrane protein At3g27390 n=1 Tax=Selaginella moellendorffii TaxID=88036 RepID=UPI000D1C7C58|nr:uncharacterized membrane protein At3g27390 [Selaginella moellendorffii]|eukprot:XP_024537062.1 uncharacterized membrane protein At3g27390 [Selaginella moellendorffii]